MTKIDIIKAAYKVWGRDLYRTTSLSQIARELKVCKPALYRHFKDKDAIMEAMFVFFFDDCAGFLKTAFDKTLTEKDSNEALLIWMRAMSEYYARNEEALFFSLIKVFNNRDRETLRKEFLKRGIDFRLSAFGANRASEYPSKMQLGMATVISFLGQFHRQRRENAGGQLNGNLREDQVKLILSRIEDRVTKGLHLDAKRVAAMNYEALEKQATGTVYEDTEINALLRAVAEAVAEAGPWNASMKMVARRSGLSKSGLYAHFKNKQDMLAQLFITEFMRIVNFAKTRIETTDVFEDQLYMAIISIVDYLRSRPEILLALDWIKTGRLDLGEELSSRLYRIINDIKVEALQNFDQHLLVRIAEWVLFMIVNTLALWPSKQEGDSLHPGVLREFKNQNMDWAKQAADIPNKSLRLLFRYIALGLEGLNECQ